MSVSLPVYQLILSVYLCVHGINAQCRFVCANDRGGTRMECCISVKMSVNNNAITHFN